MRKVNGAISTAMTQAKATLEFLSEGNRKPMEKINAVNDEIVNNILKITYDQFKQIVMIAQGEFQQALTTDTNDRSAVMRKIFQTEGYEALQNILGEKKKIFSKKVEASNNDIKNYFIQIKCDEDSVFYNELQEKKNNVINAFTVELIEKLVTAIAEEDEKSLQHEKGIRAAADKQAEIATKNLQAAETHNSNIKRLQHLLQVEKELNEKSDLYKEMEAEAEILWKVVYKIRPLHDDVKKQFREEQQIAASINVNNTEAEEAKIAEEQAALAEKTAMMQQDTARELSERSARLKGTQKSYERREKLMQQVIACEQRKVKAETEFNNVNKSIDKWEKKLTAAKNMVKQCESAPAKLVDVRNKLQQLGFCIGYMNKNLRGRSMDLQEKLRLYRQDDKNSIEADIQRDNAQAHLNRVNIEIRCNRAGILASDLKIGEKCPVCGSTEHPELAHLSGTEFTDADLDKAQAALNDKIVIANNAAFARLSALNDYRNCANDTVKRINDVIDNIAQSGEEGKNILANINWHKCAPLREMSQDDISYDVLAQNMDILEGELQKAVELKSEIQRSNKKFTDLEYDLVQKTDIFNNARQVILECEENLNNLKETHQSALDSQKKASEELEKTKGELAGIGKLEYSSLAELQKNVKKLDDEVKGINRNIEKKQKAHSDARIKSGEVAARGEMLKQQLADTRKKKEKAESVYVSALNTNGFSDEASYMVYNDKSEGDIDILLNCIKKYNEAVLENKTSVANMRKQVGDNTELSDLEELSRVQREARNVLNASISRLNTIEYRIKQNSDCWKKIHDISSRAKADMEQAAMYERLYITVSGTKAGDNKSNGKMSLEEYVQAAHFERILEAANERMKQISGGTYELCRHDEGTAEQGKTIGGNAHNCLNLDVLDTNTNKRRLARSLSGGESFMASLSLALGFSDEIMARMGGISVDTMFIDEGFGTLDGNRLTDTMNMLTNLSHGNRMIGIISHNSELEKCITNQIIVKKDATKGSSLKISIDGEIV